jgi:hypothetical protein
MYKMLIVLLLAIVPFSEMLNCQSHKEFSENHIKPQKKLNFALQNFLERSATDILFLDP